MSAAAPAPAPLDGEHRGAAAHSRWSLPLGRIGGIEVRVHASFSVLVALVLLTSGQVEGGAPAALLWLALIFACVLVHELAHCAVARRRGVAVSEILLLPIGGLSRMERLPEVARDEFAIAVVGPLSSFGLALLAGLAAVSRGDELLPPTLVVGAMPTRLFWFNLLLGAFNLLPAFPLDGGRVLRALLETRLDLEQATHQAARLGRLVAVLLVVVGVLVNLWLILIGVFVYLGAAAEEAATVLHVRLAGRRVADLMHPAPPQLAGTALDPREEWWIEADDPVNEEVLERLGHAPRHAMLAVREGRVIGVVSRGDLQHLLDQPPERETASTHAPLPTPPPPPTTSRQIWRHRHGR